MNNIRFCSKMNSFTQAKLKLLFPSYLSMSKWVTSINFFILPSRTKNHSYGGVIHSFAGVMKDFRFLL